MKELCSMGRTTTITLGQHLDDVINNLVEEGKYSSTSEVVRAGLRLLEEKELGIQTIRDALIEGENSGVSDRTIDQIVADEKKKRKAKT